MWIWMDNDLPEIIVNKYISKFIQLIGDRKIPSVTGYKKTATLFANKLASERNLTCELGMGLIAYYCPEINFTSKHDSELVLSSFKDTDTIAKYLQGFIKDAYDVKVTKESQIDSAKRLVEKGNLYLLRVNGEFVSMANVAHRTDRYGRINSVYTPYEHRNNKYASTIVEMLSNRLLDEGLIPMLYTDDSNNVSNRVYTNIGYVETGRVEDITLSKK